MTETKNNINKVYYTIGEIASMLNVNTSLIRFWEKEFKIIHPQKNKKGDRFYTHDDLKMIKTIYFLVKECGYTLGGAREKLKQKNIDDVVEQKNILETLEKIKSFLIDVRCHLSTNV